MRPTLRNYKETPERVVKTKEGGELYVVKQWLASDVWSYCCPREWGAAYPLPSYLESNTETAELCMSSMLKSYPQDTATGC